MPSLLAREQLAQFFDASPQPLCALSAVRTDSGIEDFRFQYANPAALRMLRRTAAAELEGRRLLEEGLTQRPNALFQRLVRVVETGEADGNCSFFAAEGASAGSTSLAVRCGDGLTLAFRGETDAAAAVQPLSGQRLPPVPAPGRALLEAVLHHLPARVALLRLPDFVIEYVNQAFLAGGVSRTLLGRRAEDVFPQLVHHPLAVGVRRAVATGRPYVEAELPLRMDFGRGVEERIFSVVYQPLADAQGHPVAVLGFHFDVTHQAEARACTEALLREKEQLAAQVEQERRWQQAVLTDVSQGLAVVTTDGAVLFCNPRLQELLGRTADGPPRLVGELFPFFGPDGERTEEWERPFHRATSSGLPVRNVPVLYHHPARGDVTLDVSVAPILEAGRVTSAIVTVDDVTERDRWERERASALAAEREARLRAEALARDLARSEERFRSLAETSSQAIWMTDWRGFVLSPAAGWSALTGQSHEETLGLGWLNAVHPADVKGMQRMLTDGLKTGQPQSGYCRVRRADGEWAECVSRGVPLLDEQGKVREWVGTLRDVSVERREEAALRLLSSTGAELSNTLDVAETLKAVTRLTVPALADFCIVDVLSEEGQRERVAVGHARTEDAGVAEALRKAGPAEGGPLAEALRRLEPFLVPVVHQDAGLDATARDASHRALLLGVQARSLLAVPLLARGRPLGVIGFVYAHSERRYGPLDVALAKEVCRRAALAIDNARLYQRAEEASRAKDAFLATVSHELRTPLSAILGWTRLLRGGGLSAEKQARALETLERNARVQARLVEDLLDVSRIVAGATRLEAAPVEVARVVDAALEALRPAAEAKGLGLAVTLDRTLVVSGDADRLQQVTFNLVSNAIKFTPPKGHISVRLQPSGEQAELSVSDSGQGITQDFLPHVFERFRQADSTATRSTGGLGLGLAIVRHLVELHGGTVTASSRGPGQGSTFTVRLALRHPDAAVLPARRVTPGSGPSLAGLRVLVVDDEEEMRELLCSVLSQQHAVVTTASSAAEALGVLLRERPHVLVADVAMPGEDGYQLVARVRSLLPQQGGQTPAVAVSASSGPGEAQRAQRAGFQVYLTKPVEPLELLSVVAELAASAVAGEADVTAAVSSTG